MRLGLIIHWLPGEVKVSQELGFDVVLVQQALLCCPAVGILNAAGCRVRRCHWCWGALLRSEAFPSAAQHDLDRSTQQPG